MVSQSVAHRPAPLASTLPRPAHRPQLSYQPHLPDLPEMSALVGREAIEQAGSAGCHEVRLAAAAARVRGIPGAVAAALLVRVSELDRRRGRRRCSCSCCRCGPCRRCRRGRRSSNPVRISCVFGISPTPLTMVFFSVSEICLPSALPSRACSMVSPWSSATLPPIRPPRALNHGPLPMRSRAFTAPGPCVLMYACQTTGAPRPAAVPSCWQYASAPASPP